MCGAHVGDLDRRRRVALALDFSRRRCVICAADDYSFCAECFVGWVPAFEDMVRGGVGLKRYTGSEHVCLKCVWEGALGHGVTAFLGESGKRRLGDVDVYLALHGVPSSSPTYQCVRVPRPC